MLQHPHEAATPLPVSQSPPPPPPQAHTPPDTTLPPLGTIISTRVPVFKHIPTRLRRLIREALNTVLKNLSSAPNDLTFIREFTRLTLFPAAVLPPHHAAQLFRRSKRTSKARCNVGKTENTWHCDMRPPNLAAEAQPRRTQHQVGLPAMLSGPSVWPTKWLLDGQSRHSSPMGFILPRPTSWKPSAPNIPKPGLPQAAHTSFR